MNGLFLSFSAHSDSGENLEAKYVVTKGDTLSDILHTLGFCDLYGSQGRILKTSLENKLLQKKEPLRLIPGQVLKISGIRSSSGLYYEINQNDLLVFTTHPSILSRAIVCGAEPLGPISQEEQKNPSSVTEPEKTVSDREDSSVPSAIFSIPEQKDGQIELSFIPVVSSFKLTSTDKVSGGTAKLYSRWNFGFEIKARKSMSKSISLYAGAGYLQTKYASTPSRPLLNPTLHLIRFQAGLEYHHSWYLVGLEVGQKAIEALRTTSGTELQFDKVNVVQMSALLRARVFRTQRGEFGIKSNITYGLSTRTSMAHYNAGLNSYGGNVYSIHWIKPNWKVSPEIFVNETLLESQGFKQKRIEFGGSLGLEYVLP